MPTQALDMAAGSSSGTGCLLTVSLASAGYLAYLGLVQAGWVKPRKVGRMTRKVETKKKEVNSDEWLKGTYYNQVLFSSSAPLEFRAYE